MTTIEFIYFVIRGIIRIFITIFVVLYEYLFDSHDEALEKGIIQAFNYI